MVLPGAASSRPVGDPVQRLRSYWGLPCHFASLRMGTPGFVSPVRYVFTGRIVPFFTSMAGPARFAGIPYQFALPRTSRNSVHMVFGGCVHAIHGMALLAWGWLLGGRAGLPHSALPVCGRLRAATLHAAVVNRMFALCGSPALIVTTAVESRLHAVVALSRPTFAELCALCGAWAGDGVRCIMFISADRSWSAVITAALVFVCTLMALFHVPGAHPRAVHSGRPPPQGFRSCGTCPARLLVGVWLALPAYVRITKVSSDATRAAFTTPELLCSAWVESEMRCPIFYIAVHSKLQVGRASPVIVRTLLRVRAWRPAP